MSYTTRVSVNSDGIQGNNGSSGSSISNNGRYIAFGSSSHNLVSDDNNGRSDIFVHDSLTGETTRVNVSSDGTQANDTSDSFSISGDGRYVAFASKANSLVVGDTRRDKDVFVHDRVSGETTLVSVSSDGTHGNDVSGSASISDDGRYVAFTSWADNLVASDTNEEPDVFVHDRVSGETTRVSVSSDGTQANDRSEGASISDDGRYVAFTSWADNLVPGDTNKRGDVFVHDRVNGETTRVSVSSEGTQANSGGYYPSISGNGRYVAFTSLATNLVAGDTNNVDDIFVHDRVSGETTRVSVSSEGTQANNRNFPNSISSNGRQVTFTSWADNLVASDTNEEEDVFVHDRVSGETTRVSVSSDGTQANSSHYIFKGSGGGSISGDGRHVAFSSYADNLVTGDTNNKLDVFVYSFDDSYVPAISVDNTLVVEAEGAKAVFELTLDTPSDSVVKVNYKTVNNGATAGVDYLATNGILTIPAGETSATIEVPILDDNRQERNEGIKLILSDPVNVLLDQKNAVATITDTLTTDVTTTLPQGVENLLLSGADNIDGTGNAGDNKITGNSGNNRLDGLEGKDTMAGGDGDDTYVLDSTTDRIIEKPNSGVDTIEADFSYTLKSHLENLTLTGRANLDGQGNNWDNILEGNRRHNTLTAKNGNDTLNGDRGNDTLIGGKGDDTITTGGGKDVVVFNSKREGVDTITDFKRWADLIEIKASGFGGDLTVGELSSEQFVLGTSASDADDRLVYDQTSGELWFDRDGIGRANPDQLAVFSNNVALRASNFVLV